MAQSHYEKYRKKKVIEIPLDEIPDTLYDEWILHRFCNKIGYNVPGAASRLMKYFISNYDPKQIISFSSNDISDGRLYKKLGFEYINTTKSSYWYIKQGTHERFHRSSFTKDAIIKRGWKQDKEGWTELEVMTEHGYLQIYDSGQQKWVWNNTTS